MNAHHVELHVIINLDQHTHMSCYLRIDQQRPALSPGRHNAAVHRHVISGQAIDAPLTNSHGVTEGATTSAWSHENHEQRVVIAASNSGLSYRREKSSATGMPFSLMT